MDAKITHEHFQLKKNVPELRAGDRVKIHQKVKEGNKERIQIFEGLVIKAQHGQGINGTFTVRRIASGVGVEKTFPLHLPSIVKIEKTKSARVRQAKIFYVRNLIGKSAKRLKREREDAKVWEDVVEEKVEKDPEQEQIEKEIEKTEVTEQTEEKAEDKTEENKSGKADKIKNPEKSTQIPKVEEKKK